jgi:hypothetical protein
MREYLYSDIETIPTQDERVIASIAAGVKEPVYQTEFVAPGNYKDPEKIAAWIADKKASAAEDYQKAMIERGLAVNKAIAKTSFDGGLGHICCFGFALNDSEADAITIDNIKDERDLIRESFAAMDKLRNPGHNALTWVGHNWIQFDNRFIWQRAIVLGVPLPPWFPRAVKPWDDAVQDTMVMWAGFRDMIGMDKLCEILGLEGKGDDGMDGSRVADRWAARDLLKIAEYCAGDVDRTRRMHKRFLVAYGFDWPPDMKPIHVPDFDDEVPFK